VPVQFDEREEETEQRQTGLRRPGENLTNCHREAKATAPLLDSTQNPPSEGRRDGANLRYRLITSTMILCASYGPTVRTLRQFLEAVHALAAYVRDLMLPNPDKKSA
jgi:hypothetical protein